MPFDLPPYVLALVAAFCFALGGQIQNIGVQTLDSRTGTMLSIGSNALLFWLAAPWFLKWEYFTHPAILIFVAMGLIRPALSANLSVASIKTLGPTLTTTLAATAPLFGAAFGILILDEMPTLQIVCGTIGIMLAIVILARRDARTPSAWPLWALALPIGAAAIRGFGHGFTKMGMEYIPSPFFAGLCGVTVSFIVLLTLWRRTPNRTRIVGNGRAPALFLVAGVFFGTAVMCLNVALFFGDIITVVPIVATTPIFSMIMSIIVFRREHLTLRIVLAVMIVMPSVVLIALGR